MIALVAACSSSLPSPPDPQAFQKLTVEERCEATAPRAVRCANELLVAQARALSAELGSRIERVTDDPPSASEARAMHDVSCADAAYPAAIVACWSTSECNAFAACVVSTSSKPPTR